MNLANEDRVFGDVMPLEHRSFTVAMAVLPIIIGGARPAHVLEAHSVGGALTAGKSIFNAGENIKVLIQAAESAPAERVGNVLIRTVDSAEK